MCATGLVPENKSAKASRRWPQREDGPRRLVGKKLRKHYLELGQALDGLQGPQHSEHPQGLDGLDVPALVGSAGKAPRESQEGRSERDIPISALTTEQRGRGRPKARTWVVLGDATKHALGNFSRHTPVCTLSYAHTHKYPHIEAHTGTHAHTEASMHTC